MNGITHRSIWITLAILASALVFSTVARSDCAKFLRCQSNPAKITMERGKDYTFNSPSNAAGVLLGRTANGRIEWKDASGRSLKQIQEAAAGVG